MKNIALIPSRLGSSRFPSKPLEIIESNDMLRLLENNYDIKMIPTNFITQPVDLHEDIKVVETIIKNKIDK